MTDAKPADPAYSKLPDKRKAEVLSQVLQEHDIFQAQRTKRLELLEKMASHSDSGLKVGYLAFLCSESTSIDSADIPAIGDALLSIGEVDQLNLIINSPGGDGTIAEKNNRVVPVSLQSVQSVGAQQGQECGYDYCSWSRRDRHGRLVKIFMRRGCI
jgi:hypothetical protein